MPHGIQSVQVCLSVQHSITINYRGILASHSRVPVRYSQDDEKQATWEERFSSPRLVRVQIATWTIYWSHVILIQGGLNDTSMALRVSCLGDHMELFQLWILVMHIAKSFTGMVFPMALHSNWVLLIYWSSWMHEMDFEFNGVDVSTLTSHIQIALFFNLICITIGICQAPLDHSFSLLLKFPSKIWKLVDVWLWVCINFFYLIHSKQM